MEGAMGPFQDPHRLYRCDGMLAQPPQLQCTVVMTLIKGDQEQLCTPLPCIVHALG